MNNKTIIKKKKPSLAGHQWFTPVTLATLEAVIRRITVQSQPRQTVREKNPSQKRAGRMAKGVGPEFKLEHQQNNTPLQKNPFFKRNIVGFQFEITLFVHLSTF
jgi:hypothetical protein